MSVIAKRLINHYAEAMLDFLQTCVGTDSKNLSRSVTGENL